MSWRSAQLGSQLCDQDNLIIRLFKGQSVKYVGADIDFSKNLVIDNNSSNLILILNESMWVSDLYKILHKNLTPSVTTFYIGINRYRVLGNDSNIAINNTIHHGENIIHLVNTIINNLGYSIIKQGTHDDDLGQYFNFVQPLTWIYGLYNENKSN
jgi:hypothetical protein